jgi:hypothetical protein
MKGWHESLSQALSRQAIFLYGINTTTLQRFFALKATCFYAKCYTITHFAPTRLKSEGCAYVPGRCPGLLYLALSGLVLCQLS